MKKFFTKERVEAICAETLIATTIVGVFSFALIQGGVNA
jgi:hypothetical protein